MNSSYSPFNGERSSVLYRMPSTLQWPRLWVFRHADLFHHPFLCGRIHYSRPKAHTEEYYLLLRRIFFSNRARPAVTFYKVHPHSQIYKSSNNFLWNKWTSCANALTYIGILIQLPPTSRDVMILQPETTELETMGEGLSSTCTVIRPSAPLQEVLQE